ncbi:DUF6461 domain-containing protein [Streptomyces sp. NPDC023998]|uniref:DUF6461 domain-containing protein n=1 Tax=Streptomyces sp. NPDC023998 TaxID=3154597 RepID=UPI0033FB4272
MTETSGATATDHLWFGEDFDDLYEAYCITLVRGSAPEALLSRLGAAQHIRATGVHELIEPAYDAWDMLLATAGFTSGTALLPSGS